MSELERIESAVKQAARRRRWQRAWNGAWAGLLTGATAWLLALSTYKLAPIPQSILLGAGVFAIIAILAGFFHGWLAKPSLQSMARWLDDQQHLQERLSTALELSKTQTNENWRSLVLADAARFAGNIDLRKLLPLRLPAASRWALLLLALSTGLGFVPEYRSKAYLDKKQEAEIVKDAGQKLLELTRHNLDHHAPVLEPTRKALESVQQLGLQLSKNPVTRTEALKDLANVTDKLKSEIKALGQKNPTLKSLERSARESTRSGGPTTPEQQKQIDALQKALGKAAKPNALDQIKEGLQQAQQAAANLSNNNSPSAQQARQQLSQKLSELAQQAHQLDQSIPNLDAAIAALQANMTENVARDLKAATTDLEKLQQMAKTLQQLQHNTPTGKDLAEQLKLAQVDQARETLQKMIEKLNSPAASADDLKKMLDEVSRSVDPASPYGQAAEYLQQAAKQLAQTDKPGATQSLAEASKELQKLMDQMQDARAMMGSLEALQKAELAIATKKPFGQCPTCKGRCGCCGRAGYCLGRCYGFCQGGRGGNGVGTWTDDNSQLYPQMSQLWDNSNLQRPDMDPRGLSDRGKMNLSDNLAPTKVHGQISPGGPMPSISLKGVSIKGQSSVAYKEAAAAAQSEAQSALNQDQVPRAYQGAVRDYFDDLKQ